MDAFRYRPRVHVFVCANRRGSDNPLGAGCGNAGPGLVDGLKRQAQSRGESSVVWITETACLGMCSREAGAAVAVYPQQRLVTGVTTADLAATYDDLVGRAVQD